MPALIGWRRSGGPTRREVQSRTAGDLFALGLPQPLAATSTL
ncbi:hypothetical protein [Nocardia sp. NPDC051463]